MPSKNFIILHSGSKAYKSRTLTLFNFSKLKSPLYPYPLINSLHIRRRNYSDTRNNNNLAHNVLNHFLITLQTTKDIKPKIILSKQGQERFRKFKIYDKFSWA